MDVPNSLAKASDRRVTADNGSVGHGQKGSTNRDGSHGSWVSTHDPLTHDYVHPETVEAISIAWKD